MEQLDWTMREGGCMEVIEEYKEAGKIKWIGFSTHGHASVIRAAIMTGKFDSINIHYHVRNMRPLSRLVCLRSRLCLTHGAVS